MARCSKYCTGRKDFTCPDSPYVTYSANAQENRKTCSTPTYSIGYLPCDLVGLVFFMVIRATLGCTALPYSLSDAPDVKSFSVRSSNGQTIFFESGDVLQIMANEQARIEVISKVRTKMWCSWSAGKGTLSSGILPFTQECATTYIAPSGETYDSLTVLARSYCDTQQASASLISRLCEPNHNHSFRYQFKGGVKMPQCCRITIMLVGLAMMGGLLGACTPNRCQLKLAR